MMLGKAKWRGEVAADTEKRDMEIGRKGVRYISRAICRECICREGGYRRSVMERMHKKGR